MGSTPPTTITSPTQGTIYEQPSGVWVTPTAGGLIVAGADAYDASGAPYSPGTLTLYITDKTTNTGVAHETVFQTDPGGSSVVTCQFTPTVSGHVYTIGLAWDAGPTSNFVGPATMVFQIENYSSGGGGGLTQVKVKRSGAWTTASAVKVKRSGAWVNATAVWVKRSGAWTKVWG